MEKLILESKGLLEDAEKLHKDLKQTDSHLAFIAHDAGALAYKFNSLRVEIIRKHERRQINDA